jgi:hypothetical protein
VFLMTIMFMIILSYVFLPYMLIIFIMGVTRINLMCNKVYKESSGAPPTFS